MDVIKEHDIPGGASSGRFRQNIVFSPNDRYLAVGTRGSQKNSLIKVGTWKEKIEIGSMQPTISIAFHPSGRWIAQGCENFLGIYGVATANQSVTIGKNFSSGRFVNDLLFVPGEERIITVHNDGTFRDWIVNLNGEGPIDAVENVNFSVIPNSEKRTSNKAIQSVSINSNDQSLLSACEDGTAQLWRLEENSLQAKTSFVHDREVNSAVFSPDNRHILTASKKVTLWANVSNGPATERILLPAEMKQMTFSPDGRWLAALFKPSGVSIFQTSNWLEVASFALEKSRLRIEFSFDGRWLLAVGSDRVEVYETATWDMLFSKKFEVPLKNARFAPKAPILWIQSLTEFVIFEIGTWTPVVQVPTHHDHAAAFLSPDDQLLLLRDGNFLTVFQTQNWKRLWRNEFKSTIQSLEFSHDNQVVILSTGELVGDSFPPRSQSLHIISVDFRHHKRLCAYRYPIDKLWSSPDHTLIAESTDIARITEDIYDGKYISARRRIISRNRTIWNIKTGEKVAWSLREIEQIKPSSLFRDPGWEREGIKETIISKGDESGLDVFEKVKSWPRPQKVKNFGTWTFSYARNRKSSPDKQWEIVQSSYSLLRDGHEILKLHPGFSKNFCLFDPKNRWFISTADSILLDIYPLKTNDVI